ncbi:MAG: hypothetical protein J5981_07755 [Lachnospira sp.]|nr:hypothetical protein [Lachnospira sp.]
MYGYVIVNKPEMKFKEYDRYRSYYCGLCDVLKDKYGFNGQISISYDMTFLVLLLTGLYEPETKYYKTRCVAHPVSKHEVRKNEMTDYVADMNVLMTYYKCMDDWNDEKKVTRRAFAGLLKKHADKISKKYSDKAVIIRQSLDGLSSAESAGEDNIDKAASYFAGLMSVMAAVYEDEWTQELKRLGYYLGKFIYLCDAYEDLEGDIKAGRYNVFKTHCMQEDFDGICESILNSTMAECARAFERLPIIQEAEILRNIIYSGVWTRFQAAREKRNKQLEQNRRDNSGGSV